MIARVCFFNASSEGDGYFKMATSTAYSKVLQASFDIVTFPFAFVLKANDFFIGGKEVQRGDLVRLFDFQAKTIVNPKHIAYIENGMSESNAERVGQEPEFYVNRLHENFKDDVYIIDPTKDPDLLDYHTFLFNEPDVCAFYSEDDIKIFTE